MYKIFFFFEDCVMFILYYTTIAFFNIKYRLKKSFIIEILIKKKFKKIDLN